MLKQNKYNAKNTIQIPFRLNRRTDADIIIFFEVLKKYNIPIAGHIKRVLRQDLKQMQMEAERELALAGKDDDSEFIRFISDIREIEIKEI